MTLLVKSSITYMIIKHDDDHAAAQRSWPGERGALSRHKIKIRFYKLVIKLFHIFRISISSNINYAVIYIIIFNII